MSDEKDQKTSKSMTLEDSNLWEAMTNDVEKLPGRAYVRGEKELLEGDDSPERSFLSGTETVVPPSSPEKSGTARQGQDLDGATQKRLRKGQIAIEGRLDLHGLNQDKAKIALIEFIKLSQKRGKRCVLVITGKGSRAAQSDDWWEGDPGVLKRRVPEWLSAAEMRPYVLQSHPAIPKDGGEGALYVYLRRNR